GGGGGAGARCRARGYRGYGRVYGWPHKLHSGLTTPRRTPGGADSGVGLPPLHDTVRGPRKPRRPPRRP
ncbi:hypothetical protein apy_15720, partial [Aeropyrum pernix]